ncbi:MAG: potassium channel family protein, partial [Acidobacteriota bacterium]
LAELIEPGSFHFVDGTAAVVGSRNQLFAELNYFSFVTLLTVGYGDITPVGETVRKLALLEGLFGQLFPVVVIGRMVSLELEAELMSNIDRKP